MKKHITFLFISYFFLLSFSFAESPVGGAFVPNTTLGDGKNGRVYQQWRQSIANNGVKRITAVLQKKSGGRDVYVNLRFGSGSALERGKRVFLPDGREVSASWQLNGERANGRELVMNSYNGEVFLKEVSIEYQHASRPPVIDPKPAVSPIANTAIGIVDDPEAVRRCRYSRNIRNPRIRIRRVRGSGGLFSSKYRVSGSIAGSCIEEAGYYEYGELKEEIKFPLSDRYKRQNFQVRVRTGREGEIIVHTSDGREDIIDVDRAVTDKKSLF